MELTTITGMVLGLTAWHHLLFLQAPAQISLNTALSAAAVVIAVYGAFVKRDSRRDMNTALLTELDTKVEVLWNLMIVSGVEKGLRLGLLERKSPLRMTVKALEEHKELLDRVWAIYRTGMYRSKLFKPADSIEGAPIKSLPDAELIIALEQELGSELLLLARQYDYQYEAVLLSVLYICRPDSLLFKKYNVDAWDLK